MPYQRLSIIGAGSWGLALASAAQRAGRDVTVWTRSPAAAAAIARTRQSERLPGARIDDRIAITANLEEAARCDAILLVVPAQAIRDVASALAPLITNGMPVIACAKGIERGTRKFMTEVIADAAPNAAPAILSGPSFAADVIRGLPTAVTLAAADEKVAASLTHALGSASFRPYHSTDMRGVEIGGAAKNVLAIASGVVSGRGLGASAAAALTTRGFAEIMRFGRALGAHAETLTGLSGLGDTDPVLLHAAIAQLFVRAGARARAVAAGGARQRQACRRRFHRVGPQRDGARGGGRDAGHGGRRRRGRRQGERG